MSAMPMSLSSLVSQAYPSPEWAVFFEVGNATGFRTRRHADAVALGIWPSRGHAVIGFEFKEDRRDWLREKQNPEKAEAVAQHCDCWFLVTSNDKIAPPEELPAPWGLYVANAARSKLKLVKPPVPFADRDKLVMRRGFVAAMLRKVTETTISKKELNDTIETRVAAAIETTREGRDLRHLEARCQKLQGIVDAFRVATGVNLEGWRGHAQIAGAVEAVLRGDEHRRTLEHSAAVLENTAEQIRAALGEWPQLPTPPQEPV